MLTAELKARISEDVRNTPEPVNLPTDWVCCGPDWMWRIVGYRNGKQIVEVSRYIIVEGAHNV